VIVICSAITHTICHHDVVRIMPKGMNTTIIPSAGSSGATMRAQRGTT
jgi:hypothetical protein